RYSVGSEARYIFASEATFEGEGGDGIWLMDPLKCDWNGFMGNVFIEYYF
ncbi:hypothetical protein IBX65_07630, partial [Candidatus Aerophobetes bacterium]|nr:hypothetical protein [Candidatus Aerophobetes bacterium]